jgi:hypothetical protein
LKEIRGLYPAPGFCDEQLVFFAASDLRPKPAGTHTPDEDEAIQAQAFEISDVRTMVERGEIVDLKTAYGLTLIA